MASSTIVRDLATENSIVSAVTLSQGVAYTCPCDGYLRMDCAGSSTQTAIVDVYGADDRGSFRVGHIGGNSYPTTALFVKKGMFLKPATLSNGGKAYFIPFV